jgi:hypothetical protein
LRVLAERAFILENSFKGNSDAAEIIKEIQAKFNEIIPKSFMSKGEAADLLIRCYARI